MIARFLGWLVEALQLPHRLITRDDGKPYLDRWYLCGDFGGLKYFSGAIEGSGAHLVRWWQRPFTKLPTIYLHRFLSSDEEAWHHNHPWEATSFILSGGYEEDRVVPNQGIERRVFKPGSINRIYADTFHKVLLRSQQAWSLIVIGEKVQSWGFRNPDTGEYLNWREYDQRLKEGRLPMQVYRRKQAELRRLRMQNEGLYCGEVEETLLDEMDNAWFDLTNSEKDLIRSEGPLP